jgi:serine/threonine-protein kinase
LNSDFCLLNSVLLMTPERWQQIEHLLQAALECEPAGRAALLERECDGDPRLREEVESLLDSEKQAQTFLVANALEDAAVLLKETDSDGSMIGRHVGPYSIQKQLGSGGMGEVYLAQDARLGRNVALKLLDPGLTEDIETRTRFLREARLASSLDHPNICTIHEVGEAAGHLFIAMQHVEGETLRKVTDGRPLNLDILLSISLQVADALAAAHTQGIIHRDIKPGNIIIGPRGQAKVLDFGLAKLLERAEGEAETHLTMTGAVMGTPAAMSPEQARGERVDHRSDIFSFGVVLYEMATGRIPFRGRSKADVISALLTQAHMPATELNEEIPARLSAAIDRALRKEPADRYQSMEEMITELRQVVAEAGGLDQLFSSSALARGVVPLVPPRRRGLLGAFSRRMQNPSAMAFLAVAALVLVGVAFAIYFSRPVKPQPATPIRSIAVLPFRPLLAESRDEALELGMADTLIARLSNIREINVRPISAVRKYVGLEQDAIAAGREQKVDAVLDGNIQKSGERVRVTVRLLSVAEGRQLWAEQFEEKFTDIFSVQDSVSRKVSGSLALTLTGEEKELLTKRHTDDIEAYQLYLLGRYHLNRLTDEGFWKGLDYFQRAIRKDPNYASAHAGVADAYNSLSGFNVLPPNEGFPKGKQAAQQALRLDERLAEAHIALANVKLLHDWNWAEAENEFSRALDLNPGSSEAHQMYGHYLAAMGRFDEAVREMERAHELDPLSLVKIISLGEALYLARRFDEAAAEYRKALEMDPNFGFAYWALGRALTGKGMYDEAIAAFQKAIPLSGDSPDEPAELARTYALAGKRAEALKIVDDLKRLSQRRYVSPVVMASIYGALGDKDQAFAWLERARGQRDFLLVLVKVEPLFDSLRPDPRFIDLLHRVGLEP